MLNPFYIVLVFVLYVTRWVCATLSIYFCNCFICYHVGMLNPLYIFQFLVLYVTRWVCETLFMYFYIWFNMLHSGYVKPSFMLFFREHIQRMYNTFCMSESSIANCILYF